MLKVEDHKHLKQLKYSLFDGVAVITLANHVPNVSSKVLQNDIGFYLECFEGKSLGNRTRS